MMLEGTGSNDPDISNGFGVCAILTVFLAKTHWYAISIIPLYVDFEDDHDDIFFLLILSNLIYSKSQKNRFRGLKSHPCALRMVPLDVKFDDDYADMVFFLNLSSFIYSQSQKRFPGNAPHFDKSNLWRQTSGLII